MWNFSDFSMALRSVFLTQQQRLNCVDVFICMHKYVCCCPDTCRLFRTSPAAYWCCSSSNLCSETLLKTAEHCNLYLHTDFGSKVCFLYWTPSSSHICSYSVIFGVRFERWKVDKKQNLHEDWNMQTLFYRLLNISAKYHQNRCWKFWAIWLQSWVVFWDTLYRLLPLLVVCITLCLFVAFCPFASAILLANKRLHCMPAMCTA